MHPIDCHVLINPARERFHAGCLDSLKNEPINLHTLLAVPGHIGRARMAGFRLGSAPYVSFIDDDDEAIPGSFQSCIDALKSNPAVGAYPDEILIDEAGNTIGQGRSTGLEWSFARQLTMMPIVHHGVVMRRELVLPLLSELDRWHKYPEQILFGLLAKLGDWIHVPSPGYKWRRHSDQVTSNPNSEVGDVIRYLVKMSKF